MSEIDSTSVQRKKKEKIIHKGGGGSNNGNNGRKTLPIIFGWKIELKWLSLILLIVQNTFLVLMMRYSRYLFVQCSHLFFLSFWLDWLRCLHNNDSEKKYTSAIVTSISCIRCIHHDHYKKIATSTCKMTFINIYVKQVQWNNS